MGGIEESFSYDEGRTWTIAKGNLPDPLIGPGSRFTMINIKDGEEDALLFVTNYSTAIRGNMTAFLSYDDGLTWPYSITLDSHLSAYPDAYQAPDGKIYIVYDKGRYTEGGVRLCVLRIEDLKAGKFVSEDSINRLSVTKSDPEWADIVSVNDAFPSTLTVKNGTKLSKLTADLPTKFTITDSNGNNVEITGQWSGNNYRAKDAGVYVVKFQCKLPGKLVDTYELLSIEVTVTEGGCAGSIDGGLLFLLPIAVATLLIVKKERKYER